MFYLVGPSRTFFLGFVEEDQPVATLLEGNSIKGITSKAEMRCETQVEAWMGLCEQVTGFLKAGYIASTFPGLEKFVPPERPFVGLFPEELKGVHVRFTSLTQEQLAAGLCRLQEVHEALTTKPKGTKLTATEYGFEFVSHHVKVALCKLSPAQWETYGVRAQEIFEDRKSIDATTLLPSGEGEWWLPTQGGLLDVYLRAFLGEVWNAGGRFTANGGESWILDVKKPFDTASVINLPWYQQYPGIFNELSKAGLLGGRKLAITPAAAPSGFSFFL